MYLEMKKFYKLIFTIHSKNVKNKKILMKKDIKLIALSFIYKKYFLLSFYFFIFHIHLFYKIINNA
jgi:hypothetical protein